MGAINGILMGVYAVVLITYNYIRVCSIKLQLQGFYN